MREQSKEQLEQILDAVPGGVVHVGPDGSIRVANLQAWQFLGLARDEVSGVLVQQFGGLTFRDDGTECPVEEYPVSRCLATRLPQPPMTIGVQQPSGEVRWAVFTAQPVEMDDGIGAVVTFVDITERKRAEQKALADARALHAQLAQAERFATIGTLATAIAHEVNNPLAYVMLSLDAARRETVRLRERVQALAAALEAKLGGDAARALLATVDLGDADAKLDKIDEHAADAREGSMRVRDIVRELMTFSRVHVDRQGAVDVNGTVRSALKMARHEIKHRAQLVEEYGELPPVHGNDGRLSQVFLNLLLNAARAIPEGDAKRHCVAIRTWQEGARVRVEVRDSGAGIAPEHLERIFEPFFTTRDQIGVGLGLAICHDIVRSFDGTIDITSVVGQGTRVVVTLPASAREP